MIRLPRLRYEHAETVYQQAASKSLIKMFKEYPPSPSPRPPSPPPPSPPPPNIENTPIILTRDALAGILKDILSREETTSHASNQKGRFVYIRYGKSNTSKLYLVTHDSVLTMENDYILLFGVTRYHDDDDTVRNKYVSTPMYIASIQEICTEKLYKFKTTKDASQYPYARFMCAGKPEWEIYEQGVNAIEYLDSPVRRNGSLRRLEIPSKAYDLKTPGKQVSFQHTKQQWDEKLKNG